MSERYPRSGDSEFARAEKPFVINPRSRAAMVRPIRVPDWLVSLVRAIPDQGSGPIQFGSAAYQAAMGPREINEIYGNEDSCRVMDEGTGPDRRGRADRISPTFRLTIKGQSIMIRRQE
jgi:hypothetical protein